MPDSQLKRKMNRREENRKRAAQKNEGKSIFLLNVKFTLILLER